MQQWVSINNACDIDESTLTETKSTKRRLPSFRGQDTCNCNQMTLLEDPSLHVHSHKLYPNYPSTYFSADFQFR